MKNKTILFYSDPGHGWAKVKKTELQNLGIANQISPYSYQRGEWAYLEEDCDLSLYLNTLDRLGMKFEFRGNTSAYRQSRIRNYERYQP